jgi:hypothetical protein
MGNTTRGGCSLFMARPRAQNVAQTKEEDPDQRDRGAARRRTIQRVERMSMSLARCPIEPPHAWHSSHRQTQA